MKYVFVVLSALFSTTWVGTAKAEPPGPPPFGGGACGEFIRENCEGQRPHECLEKNKDRLPTACRDSMGKREAGRKALESKCGNVMADCKERGPGPAMFACLEEKGSEACKAEARNMKQRFGKQPAPPTN